MHSFVLVAIDESNLSPVVKGPRGERRESESHAATLVAAQTAP